MVIKMTTEEVVSPISTPYRGPTNLNAELVSPIARVVRHASGEIAQTLDKLSLNFSGILGRLRFEIATGTSERQYIRLAIENISKPASPTAGIKNWEQVTDIRSTIR